MPCCQNPQPRGKCPGGVPGFFGHRRVQPPRGSWSRLSLPLTQDMYGLSVRIITGEYLAVLQRKMLTTQVLRDRRAQSRSAERPKQQQFVNVCLTRSNLAEAPTSSLVAPTSMIRSLFERGFPATLLSRISGSRRDKPGASHRLIYCPSRCILLEARLVPPSVQHISSMFKPILPIGSSGRRSSFSWQWNLSRCVLGSQILNKPPTERL